MKGKKKQLHKAPVEFAEAEKARSTEDWKQRMERALRRAKRDHERIMPAHQRPLTREEYLMKIR